MVRGSDPTVANLAGYAVAASLDPQFALLEIRSRTGTPYPGTVVWGTRVAPERHLVAFAPEHDASVAAPDPRTAWPIARADQLDDVFSYLPEFLAAPEASEQTLRRRFPIHRPMAILIANGWVVARELPDDPRVTGRLMEVQKEFGISVVLVTDRTPRTDLVVFDVVFDVIGSDGGGGSVRLRCARAPAGADFRAGDEIELDARRPLLHLSGGSEHGVAPPAPGTPTEPLPKSPPGGLTASAKL
ncbi:MAG: hypothetical protein ACHQ16_01975 [Candidatus Lutacidiplasmatales archaeon]